MKSNCLGTMFMALIALCGGPGIAGGAPANAASPDKSLENTRWAVVMEVGQRAWGNLTLLGNHEFMTMNGPQGQWTVTADGSVKLGERYTLKFSPTFDSFEIFAPDGTTKFGSGRLDKRVAGTTGSGTRMPLEDVPPAAAPRTPAEWQQEAVRLYPDLKVRGSRLNELFTSEHARLKAAAPGFFDSPKWPLTLAQQCAARLDPNPIPGLGDPPAVPPAPLETPEQTTALLSAMILPSFEFSGAPVNEVLAFLTDKTRNLDPHHRGVLFEMLPGGDSLPRDTRITVSVKDSSIADIVKSVANSGQLRYRILAGKVEFAGTAKPSGQFATRRWHVPRKYFGLDHNPSDSECRKAFQRAGVTFPPGSSITYNSLDQSVVAKNDEAQLDAIDREIAKVMGRAPRN